MAERHEIEAWVNPSDWDDPEAGRRAVEVIVASGANTEAEWVQIIADLDAEPAPEAVIEAAARDYDRAAEEMGSARDTLPQAVRTAVTGGMTKYRAAQLAGFTPHMVTKIMNAGP